MVTLENAIKSFIQNQAIAEYSDNTQKKMRQLFNKISSYEEKFDKELYEFSDEEILEMAAECLGKTPRSVWQNLNMLKGYVGFCKESGLTTENNLEKFTFRDIDITERYKRSMFKNPQHLLSTIDETFMPIRHNLMDNIYRVVVWLLYSGIDFDDIGKVKKKNVDIENLQITYNRKKYEIYKESVKAFQWMIKAHGYVKLFKGTEVFYPMPKIDELLRIDKEGLSKLKGRYFNFIQRKGEIKHSFAINDIAKSGVFYRIYQKELQGIEPSFEEFSDGNLNNHEVKYHYKDHNVYHRDVALQRVFEAREDYKRWKQAFEL